MEKMTVLSLLKRYEYHVKKGNVQFLTKVSEQKEILLLLKKLIDAFEEATTEKEKNGKDFSEILDWHKIHKMGRDLWKVLGSDALKHIDKQSKGTSQLFEFLEAATEFEDLLYGLEDTYRDHTLHSLWVYLIGDYILRDQIPNIYNNLNWYLYNDIEGEKSSLPPRLVDSAKKKEKELCNIVNQKKDAIWCIIALCHDLGYSLEKLNKLNDKVITVLKFFDLPDFQHVGYSLDIEHQYHISQFLELLAMDIRMVPTLDNKEISIRGYKEDSTYWRLCRSLEKKKHGLLSAYLIYKILGIFADSWVRGSAEEWGLEDEEAIDNIIRGDILFAIAQHQFDFAYLNQLSSLSDILILSDELEEFSRFGRQLSSRKYYDTTAETKLAIKPAKPKQGDNIEININYDVAKHLGVREFNIFFKRKAEQLCKMYSLEQEKGKDKYCTIKAIKITVTKDNKKLHFHLLREPVYKGYLPKTRVNEETYDVGEYDLTSLDDKLYVNIKDKKILLDDWIENAAQ